MIILDNVTLRRGGSTTLAAQSLHVPPGAHIALMGPSGCGKSTLLRLVVGLEKPSSGTVTVNAKRIGYAFQEPRLLPWLTAAENIEAVLPNDKAARRTAPEWLEKAGLSEAAELRPQALSGGMQQRVNLIRALAVEPDLLLLDEPLTGLDDERRDSLLSLLKAETAGKTLLLATHDRQEAEALTACIYSYRNGRFCPET